MAKPLSWTRKGLVLLPLELCSLSKAPQPAGMASAVAASPASSEPRSPSPSPWRSPTWPRAPYRCSAQLPASMLRVRDVHVG